MKWELPADVAGALLRAEKEALVPDARLRQGAILDRHEVEACVPHRDPFLFIDEVLLADLEGGLLAARFGLAGVKGLLAGHFPGRPMWPGTLQVEAVAQAGGLLCQLRAGIRGPAGAVLTHILGARFMRPIGGEGDLVVAAQVLDEGLLSTIVGQCLYQGEICSVAAVNIAFM